MKPAIALAFIAACGVEATPFEDPDPDAGKADGSFAPLDQGDLVFGGTQELGFSDNPFAYTTFELTGSADIALETKGAGDADTVLYVYRPDGSRWGKSLARDDDGGDGAYSKLALKLDAGAYRVLVARKGTALAHVQLAATCSGAGCARPQRGCAPLDPRTSAPDLFVGPTQWEPQIEAVIDRATASLDVQMYLFNIAAIADHIVAAKRDRGVSVRVILDADEPNGNAINVFKAGGVDFHFAPKQFSFSHAKYVIVDGREVMILSGNFNGGATTNERNFAIVDRDRDDIADVRAIFEADFADAGAPDLACTRLIVSPVNSADRILAHAASATATLDIASMYVTEPRLQDAIIDRAAHGVAVRVLLADAKRNPQNAETKALFESHGIPVKLYTAGVLHAKMLDADGVVLVGSENMSSTSWSQNREVGALVAEPGPAGIVHDQFEADWAAAN